MSIQDTILGIISSVESGNQNIANTTATTSSGQAQGFYQITTGTWNQYAPQAGVSLSVYPTPLSAPQSVQASVASVIPLQQWASSTVNAVQNAFGGNLNPAQNINQISGNVSTSGPTTPFASGGGTAAGNIGAGILNWLLGGGGPNPFNAATNPQQASSGIALRIGVAILAFMLIGVGLAALALKTSVGGAVSKAVESVK